MIPPPAPDPAHRGGRVVPANQPVHHRVQFCLFGVFMRLPARFAGRSAGSGGRAQPPHRAAVPLRDAIARAGGFRISDGFISPLDLVEIGLVSAEEAQELHELEMSAAAKTS